MNNLSKTYWNTRYINNTTGWDLGEASEPLKHYFDQIKDKSIRILIPGAGNAYEAEYLHNKEFTNVFVIDIASEALQNIRKRVPDFPIAHLINDDFFNLEGSYDLIIEQTFFCAINPDLRQQYVKKGSFFVKYQWKVSGFTF